MNKLPPAVVEAQSKNQQILELTGEEKTYYFRKPGRPELNRFMTDASKGKIAQGVQNLVSELAIAPSAEELKAEFEEKPGRMVALNNALQTAIGMNEDFTTKKL